MPGPVDGWLNEHHLLYISCAHQWHINIHYLIEGFLEWMSAEQPLILIGLAQLH